VWIIATGCLWAIEATLRNTTKDDEAWDYAENVLREILKQRKANFFEAGQ